MGIGFTEDQALKTAVAFVEAHPKQFVIEGVFTHFATADALMILISNSKLTSSIIWSIFLPSRPRYVHVSNSATSCGMRLAMAI